MNQNSAIEKIKAKLEAFEKQKRAFLKELREEFPSLFKELFAQAPNLKSVGWTQYTPYFSDDDKCIFSVHADVDCLYINKIHHDDLDDCEEAAISISPFISSKLLTDEDVIVHKELCSQYGRWYSNATIGQFGLAPNPKYDGVSYKILEEISDMLRNMPEEILEELFGDHVKVTVFSNGNIVVDDYSHD